MWMEVFGTRLATNVRILLQRPSAAALDSQHRDSLRTHFLVSLQLAAASLSSGISFCSFKDLVLRWFLSFAALECLFLLQTFPFSFTLLLFFWLYFWRSFHPFHISILIINPLRVFNLFNEISTNFQNCPLLELFPLKNLKLKNLLLTVHFKKPLRCSSICRFHRPAFDKQFLEHIEFRL